MERMHNAFVEMHKEDLEKSSFFDSKSTTGQQIPLFFFDYFNFQNWFSKAEDFFQGL